MTIDSAAATKREKKKNARDMDAAKVPKAAFFGMHLFVFAQR